MPPGPSMGWRSISQRFRHGGNQLVRKKWLPQNPNGWQMLGDGQHSPRVGPSRHGNDSGLWKAGAQLPNGFRAVLNRHVQVGDDQVGGAGAIPRHSLLAVRSQNYVVAGGFEGLLQHHPRVFFVVYDKDSRHRQMRPVYPPASSLQTKSPGGGTLRRMSIQSTRCRAGVWPGLPLSHACMARLAEHCFQGLVKTSPAARKMSW